MSAGNEMIGRGGIVPGPKPGTIFIPGMGMQMITDWREDNIYDMETLPAAIPAGTTFTFFRNLAIAGVPKTLLQTNMVTPSQLPSGQRAIVYGIHFMNALGTGHDDALRVYGNSYGVFITGNTKNEKEGPLWMFPCPYGLTGYIAMDGNAAVREAVTINNGVPSPASIGALQVTVDLVDELTFQATVRFDNAVTLDVPVNLYCILRAYIQVPVR